MKRPQKPLDFSPQKMPPQMQKSEFFSPWLVGLHMRLVDSWVNTNVGQISRKS